MSRRVKVVVARGVFPNVPTELFFRNRKKKLKKCRCRPRKLKKHIELTSLWTRESPTASSDNWMS